MGSPRQIFLALFLDFNIEQNQGMHTKVDVLLDPVVETIRLPSIREKHERHSLSEIIELQATCTGSVHDRCVVDHSDWNFEGASS